MDVIKVEPGSRGEANLTSEEQAIVNEHEEHPLPFMFCAVEGKYEVETGDVLKTEEEVAESEVSTMRPSNTCSRRRSSRGRPLSGQSREIVYNVATYLQNQKKEFRLRYNVAKSTSEATGVSETTVYDILKEGKALKAKGCLKFSTPSGKKNSRKKRIEVDDFVREAIKRKIQEFYTVKKTVPTLTTLNQSLKEDGIIDCGREFLRLTLKSLGFTWHKTQSKRKMISDGGIDDAVATQRNCSNSGSDVSETSMECSSDECA